MMMAGDRAAGEGGPNRVVAETRSPRDAVWSVAGETIVMSRSPAAVLAMQRAAGNRATAAAIGRRRVSRRTLARLGYPLGSKRPAGSEKPAYGEDRDQRRYSKAQFSAMWAAQFHALSSAELDNVDRGCIGLSALNLGIGPNDAPPVGEVYGTFNQARRAVVTKNSAYFWFSDPFAGTPLASPEPPVYVLFAMLFWSNRNAPNNDKPDPKAFRPDPATSRVDMSKIGDIYNDGRPDSVNFDFGFWDEASHSFWHANHGEYGKAKDPEKIYQSTKEKFAHSYWDGGEEHVSYDDFDRVVYGVAKAKFMPEQIIFS